MARPPRIRITENDKKEFARLARNTKAKLYRTEKKYGNKALKLIPDEIKKIPTSVEEFSTRKEYNEWKNQQRGFTNRANRSYQFRENRKGVVATEREIIEAKEANRRERRNARKAIEKAEEIQLYHQGKALDQTYGQKMKEMGRPNAGGINMPGKFDFDKMDDRSKFERRKERMKQRANPEHYSERNKTMRDNFIEILELSFNSDADELTKMLKNVHPDEFFEMYLKFDEFDFDLYDSEGNSELEGDNAQNHINQMIHYIERWDEYKSDMSIF